MKKKKGRKKECIRFVRTVEPCLSARVRCGQQFFDRFDGYVENDHCEGDVKEVNVESILWPIFWASSQTLEHDQT